MVGATGNMTRGFGKAGKRFQVELKVALCRRQGRFFLCSFSKSYVVRIPGHTRKPSLGVANSLLVTKQIGSFVREFIGNDT